MDVSLSPLQLKSALASAAPPLVLDVRQRAAFIAAVDVVAGALRRDPEQVAQWGAQLPTQASIVVYCVHGHRVSQNVAASLRGLGLRARILDAGIEGWRSAGGPLRTKSAGVSTLWVTRERPKIDRIACPWLIARFIDPDAQFLYVPSAEVRSVATARSAIPYDIENVEFGHAGDRCSFDAFIAGYRLGGDPALGKLAGIVRGADTGHLEVSPESAGLLAISIGLSRLHPDDHVMLRHGMSLYDALYRWCKEGHEAAHTWRIAAGQ
jgi:rhodanese-related sulfurtransferase